MATFEEEAKELWSKFVEESNAECITVLELNILQDQYFADREEFGGSPLSSTGTATPSYTQLGVLLILWTSLPEIHKFWSYDPDLAYVIYLTLCEYMKAVVCLYLIRNVFGYAAAVWFFAQAINEATLDNVWQEETWKEYAEWAAFLVLAMSAYLFHRFNR